MREKLVEITLSGYFRMTIDSLIIRNQKTNNIVIKKIPKGICENGKFITETYTVDIADIEKVRSYIYNSGILNIGELEEEDDFVCDGQQEEFIISDGKVKREICASNFLISHHQFSGKPNALIMHDFIVLLNRIMKKNRIDFRI